MAAKKSNTNKKPNPQKVFGSKGVFYKFPDGVEGQIHINIDFGQVRPPDRYYYADCVHVRLDREMSMAVLSFGHRNENTDTFSDRIDVVMPIRALIGTFYASIKPVEEAVDKILEAAGTTVELRPTTPTDSKAPTLFANILFAAAGEGESSFDFYHLSPREVHLAKTQRTDMNILPTVRVIMSSVLTKYFFKVLSTLVQTVSTNKQVPERNKSVARAR